MFGELYQYRELLKTSVKKKSVENTKLLFRRSLVFY